MKTNRELNKPLSNSSLTQLLLAFIFMVCLLVFVAECSSEKIVETKTEQK